MKSGLKLTPVNLLFYQLNYDFVVAEWSSFVDLSLVCWDQTDALH